MAVDEEYLGYIKDQLGEFGSVDTRKMFGGVGIFRDGTMFAMIAEGIFRLKADESTLGMFEARGMERFRSGQKKGTMPYWEVPADILEDPTELGRWAETAFKIVKKAKK